MATETETTEMVDDDECARGQESAQAVSSLMTPKLLRAELERTKAALKNSNKEAATRRHRLEELEAAEAEREKASLSEVGGGSSGRPRSSRQGCEAERRAEALETALKRTRINSAVEREAAKLGFIYPEIAPRLIDETRIQIDEDTGQDRGRQGSPREVGEGQT